MASHRHGQANLLQSLGNVWNDHTVPSCVASVCACVTELHKRSRGDIELNKKRTRRGCVAPPGPPAEWQKQGLVMDFGGNPATKRRYFLSHLNPYVSMIITNNSEIFLPSCQVLPPISHFLSLTFWHSTDGVILKRHLSVCCHPRRQLLPR